MNTPGKITHKQLVRSWNKVARDYIKEGKSVFNVIAEAFNDGYNRAKEEHSEEINRLKLALKNADNTRTESAVKLANAMGQSQDAMAHAIRYILGGV
jgi:hypothetical protein